MVLEKGLPKCWLKLELPSILPVRYGCTGATVVRNDAISFFYA